MKSVQGARMLCALPREPGAKRSMIDGHYLADIRLGR